MRPQGPSRTSGRSERGKPGRGHSLTDGASSAGRLQTLAAPPSKGCTGSQGLHGRRGLESAKGVSELGPGPGQSGLGWTRSCEQKGGGSAECAGEGQCEETGERSHGNWEERELPSWASAAGGCAELGLTRRSGRVSARPSQFTHVQGEYIASQAGVKIEPGAAGVD